MQAQLSELGKVSVELIKAQERKSWTSMMHSFHPQGQPQLPGKALKYWIVSAHYGRLGGLSFHAASWHEHARDAYIGWGGRARVDNLALVVNNARFLILPEVQVYGLASLVLEAALVRLGPDWHQLYCDQLHSWPTPMLIRHTVATVITRRAGRMWAPVPGVSVPWGCR